MASKLSQIKNQRLTKIKDIQALNVDPYPQPDLSQRQSCQQDQKSMGKK